MDFRPLALVALATSSVACTVMNDMDGYTGGSRDTGTVIVDTGVAVDTSLPDTAKPDTTVEPDTEVTDEGVDTAMTDTAMPDTTTPDTTVTDTAMPDTAVMDTAMPDVSDAPSCGTAFESFGLSEFQVRGTFGTGDKREWVEITNYGTSALDVSGLTVKIISGSTERASLTLPAATSVAAGGAIVIVGEKATFTADVMSSFGIGSVFEFAKMDYIVNSASSEVRLIASGCTVPYETAVIPSKMYSIGQPWAYPAPGGACPASARLTGTALGSAWKEVPTTTPSYGSYAIETGMQILYGTPTKTNNVGCP